MVLPFCQAQASDGCRQAEDDAKVKTLAAELAAAEADAEETFGCLCVKGLGFRRGWIYIYI